MPESAREIPSPAVAPAAFADPEYRQAVQELLAAVAYGELSAFERLAEDVKLAPTVADKVELGDMAATEFEHLRTLLGALRDMDVDPYAAMDPFREPIDSFHRNTAPADWWEGLVKAYVGDGLAADFYTEIAAYLDPQTRALVVETLSETGHSEFVVQRVRAAIDENPRLAGRLALWGRRLMGEALVQGQRVAAERDALAALLAGGIDRPGLDLAAIGRMFTRLTERHTERMTALGLDA